MSGKVRVNISVSSEVHEFYKEKSEMIGTSMSAYMSYILYAHMHSTLEGSDSVIPDRQQIRR